VVKYTADEYQLYFEDAEWTKEDTDNLFELCERFDLRFPVIADRLEGGKSIEVRKKNKNESLKCTKTCR